jgi:hypothetical protein
MSVKIVRWIARAECYIPATACVTYWKLRNGGAGRSSHGRLLYTTVGTHGCCHKAEVPGCGPERSCGANLTSEVLDINEKTGGNFR